MIDAFARGSDRLFKAALTTSAVVALTLTAVPAHAAEGESGARAAAVFMPAAASAFAASAPVSVPARATMAPIPNDGEEAYAIVPAAEGGEGRAAGPVSRGEEHCLATAIYFEARGESEKGQLAVAEVIVARTKTPGRPSTICGVVYEGAHRRTGCQFSFTCDRASDVAPMNEAWSRARRIAGDVLSGAIDTLNSVVRGATFYHANYVRPRWASQMVRVAQIGTHIFYRPKRGRYS